MLEVLKELGSFICQGFFDKIWKYIVTTRLFLFIKTQYNNIILFRGLFLFSVILLFIAIYFLQKYWKKFKELEPKAISFQDLCIKINALLIKNKDLHREFGPNGNDANANDRLKDENDLLLWTEIKEKDIKENNQKILALIQANESLIFEKNKPLFNKMISHIKAFELHIENDNFDYSLYQFPNEFAEFIKNECRNINSKQIKQIEDWIRKEIKNISIAQISLLGSILNDYFNNIGDVDILILLNEKTNTDIAILFKKLKIKFYKKFKKQLHLTICSIDEEVQYKEFKNKVNKMKGF